MNARVDQAKEIKLIVKFAEIDNKPYSEEHDGWVSCFVKNLEQTLDFYFRQTISVELRKETDSINEKDFENSDSIIYILSPAFIFSSNIAGDISAIEKAVHFNTDYMNAKIHKVLKGPVNTNDLPVTISMGTFHYFYQTAHQEEDSYETLFDWDDSTLVRNKYWESFTNLLFDLLKSLKHRKQEHFIPKNEQVIFLGAGDDRQLWNRTNLLGEMKARGVKVLPDHDHSIEVKHLNEPIKFYLKQSNLAVHFPEEFLPLDKSKLQVLTDLNWLKRYIWFDPESEKELEKKKQYDELKQKLKNLDHIEAISSGIEELKEIIFAGASRNQTEGTEAQEADLPRLYLISDGHFPEEKKREIIQCLREQNVELFLHREEKVQERRTRHYQYLKEADYCLICYNGGSPEWIQANVNEVKKSVGLNPEKIGKLKLGIIIGKGDIPDHLPEHSNSLKFLFALSPSFEEDLNRFIHGK